MSVFCILTQTVKTTQNPLEQCYSCQFRFHFTLNYMLSSNAWKQTSSFPEHALSPPEPSSLLIEWSTAWSRSSTDNIHFRGMFLKHYNYSIVCHSPPCLFSGVTTEVVTEQSKLRHRFQTQPWCYCCWYCIVERCKFPLHKK